MKKGIKRYPANQSPFYKLTTKKKLEEIMYMEPGESCRIAKSISYRVFSNKKSSGGYRKIEAPASKLKMWQRRIWTLLARIDKPSWVISGTVGKSYRDNAAIHSNNGFVLTMDIKAFYDACEREHVYRFFNEKMRCSKDVAAILTDICTFDGGIPTGSPASQIVAYFAYEEMFLEIASIAKSYGCLFSLYVDDMTFSSSDDFPWGKLSSDINSVLRRYGHSLKRSKTQYYPSKMYKVITGVALSPNGELRATNSLRLRILNNLHALKESEDLSLLPKVIGQIQATEFVEQRRMFQGIGSELARLTEQSKR